VCHVFERRIAIHESCIAAWSTLCGLKKNVTLLCRYARVELGCDLSTFRKHAPPAYVLLDLVEPEWDLASLSDQYFQVDDRF